MNLAASRGDQGISGLNASVVHVGDVSWVAPYWLCRVPRHPLLPRPFVTFRNLFVDFWRDTDPRRDPPLPARIALYARSRPGLAR